MTDFSPAAVTTAIEDNLERTKAHLAELARHDEILSNHVDQVADRYDRSRDLDFNEIDIPDWVKVAPNYGPYTSLTEASQEQLRCALILWKLRRLCRGEDREPHRASWLMLRAMCRAEERIRCRLLSAEALAKASGVNL